jgi:PTS system nitrogen regulatory IIA component
VNAARGLTAARLKGREMDLSDLIGPKDVISSAKARSKRQLLQDLAESAELKTGISARQIFETLLQRERLGSTGVGNGIAIPHGKLAGLKKISGVFARLDKPIDYEALDDQPVDIVFLLLAPEGAGADHLKALARIARVLRETETVNKLRESRDAAAIYALLTEAPASNAA